MGAVTRSSRGSKGEQAASFRVIRGLPRSRKICKKQLAPRQRVPYLYVMKICFPIAIACMMLMVAPTSVKAQVVFGAYLHEIENDAASSEAEAWAREAEGWAATVRANVARPETETGQHVEDNIADWLKMISRTEDVIAVQQERTLEHRDFSDTSFSRKRALELWENVSRARTNAAFAQQMALDAQAEESVARALYDSLKQELGDWRYERWSNGYAWERVADAQGVAYKTWLKAADAWDQATRSLGFVAEQWDEAQSMEVSDLFDILHEHLTPEGVIAVGWEKLPLLSVTSVPAFANVDAFNARGDINEHAQFGYFADMQDLWPTDIELDSYLLDFPPGCMVRADALQGSEDQQDFVACIISFVVFQCYSGAYIFKIDNEYRAWSSNTACATHD